MIDTTNLKPSRIVRQKRRKGCRKDQGCSGGKYNDHNYYRKVKRNRGRIKEMDPEQLPAREPMKSRLEFSRRVRYWMGR